VVPSGYDNTEPDPRTGQYHSLFQHEPNDARALCAEGQANSGLTGALFHIVRDDSIDSDDGERKGDEREGCHDLRGKPGARNRDGEKCFHGDNIGDRLILVDAQHSLAKRGYRSTIPLYRADRALCDQIRTNHLQYQQSEKCGHEDQPPTKNVIREALEKALLVENPSSLTDLAKQLGFFNVATVRGKYPDLCSAISRKRTIYRQRMLEIQKQVLILALAEDPVPSLPELKRRLGLKYYTTITERFPDLSEALVSKRKDQRLHYLSSMRKVIEELLERPKLRWKDVLASTGKSRSFIAATFPDLCTRIISSKNKDYLDAERAKAIELAKSEVRRVVDELLSKGLQPSIELVWRAVPKRPCHGKTMVERILRSLREDIKEDAGG